MRCANRGSRATGSAHFGPCLSLHKRSCTVPGRGCKPRGAVPAAFPGRRVHACVDTGETRRSVSLFDYTTERRKGAFLCRLQATVPCVESYGETFVTRVCGLDEAGRGPLAGPLVAAAVVLPPNFLVAEQFPALKFGDSKKLSIRQRAAAVEVIP